MRKSQILQKQQLYDTKQVASELHVVESCYANWEQGRTEPNIAMLRKLANLFNVSIDELLNGD